MSLLRSRLRRLEERPAAKQCPECGLCPDESEAGRVFITDGTAGPFPKEQEWCSGCGRPKFFFIEIVDPEEEEGA